MTTLAPLAESDVKYCTHRAQLLQTFNDDIAGQHEMTVLHEQGLHRHLRFRSPKSYQWAFDLITWPGHLSITGDIGTYVFARTVDMTTFFNGYINTGYWAEKIQHGSGGGRASVKSHDEDKFLSWVKKDFEECSKDLDPEDAKQWWAAIEELVLDEYVPKGTQDECLHALQEVGKEEGVPEEQYLEAYESDWTTYDWHFELALAAIVSGIRAFNESKQEQNEQPAA